MKKTFISAALTAAVLNTTAYAEFVPVDACYTKNSQLFFGTSKKNCTPIKIGIDDGQPEEQRALVPTVVNRYGEILGTMQTKGAYVDMVFSAKAYLFPLLQETGKTAFLRTSSTYYEYSNCSGRAFKQYARGTVFLVDSDTMMYAPIDARSVENTYVRSVFNGTYNRCTSSFKTLPNYFYEVFPNDPMVTGVPNPEDLADGAPYSIGIY